MLLVGFVPGPNNPKDLDSFLWPLVEEMLHLEVGLESWNAATQQTFKLHACITIITADMPGREKLMQMKGNRAYRYCNYCLCHGIYNGAIYCPFSPPSNPPNTIKDEVKLQWRTYDRVTGGDRMRQPQQPCILSTVLINFHPLLRVPELPQNLNSCKF